MLKAKKYDWKDSNLALFGSDTEKQVCKTVNLNRKKKIENTLKNNYRQLKSIIDFAHPWAGL